MNHALCIDKVRFVGDPVAAVAAIDEDVAFDAMNLIEVEYERLNTITSIEEAIMIDEPRIHEYGDDANVHRKSRSNSAKLMKDSRQRISFAKTPFSMRAIRICR